ncbi:MAG: FdhF/YdeP family oxidoreductase [Steroidobacteraceae bacterium]
MPDDVPFQSDPPTRAGGWGALHAVERILHEQGALAAGSAALLKQNKHDGFACVSCAWAKPREPRTAEFCENGAKATAWELTGKRVPRDLFARHTVEDLQRWSDLQLEDLGRLTHPLRWDGGTYVEATWDEAIDGIASALRRLRSVDPKATVFYASGRASLEASYLYQLLARAYGNNNLPDSSNMCHETTSVALPPAIGVPVGTVTLDDFEHCDTFFIFGHNTGVSSPRMLHPLKEARERGAKIVTFNPLKERGLMEFADPQSPRQMLSRASTTLSTQYLQPRLGGDRAALAGLCKAIFERHPEAVDRAFIAEHTQGARQLEWWLATQSWPQIEKQSGLERADLERAARTFADASAVIGIYGMGLTQHRKGVQTVQMLTNLLLMGGHIGRPGAGICPVRGHSNVQGQRTVGITEKPELAPLDRLRELYHFEPPRDKGRGTVETCEGVIDGSVKGFIGLGGNFLRAAPDTARLEGAWRDLELTVHVATKLNRGHLFPGRAAFILPCLGRIEIDRQDDIEQWVSMEDSTGFFHGSHGVTRPASTELRSEIDIVAALAEKVVPDVGRIPWQTWKRDYAQIRSAIEATWPDVFRDFNARFREPGGFHRPLPARERVWKTPSGKAQFLVPDGIESPTPAPFTFMTIRSDNQFNTTVYRLDDHYRGIEGTRDVVLMNERDLRRLRIAPGQSVRVRCEIDDGFVREVSGLRALAYDIPAGCVAGYYPECNALVPVGHHAEGSHVPAYKSIPVSISLVGATP